ncbi:MAG: hypothetical protein IH991_21650 [Planctomycetes bacterium]|nr:hypothetical protein [Planctomycetota bacterium]
MSPNWYRFRLVHLFAFVTLLGVVFGLIYIFLGPMFFVPDDDVIPLIGPPSNESPRTYSIDAATLLCNVRLSGDTVVEVQSAADEADAAYELIWVDVVRADTRRRVWEIETMSLPNEYAGTWNNARTYALAGKDETTFALAYVEGRFLYFTELSDSRDANYENVVVKMPNGRKTLQRWPRRENLVELHDLTGIWSAYTVKNLRWRNATWQLEIAAGDQRFLLKRRAAGEWIK